MKILIDRSLDDRFQLAESVGVKVSVVWGGQTLNHQISGVRLKRKLLSSTWLLNESTYLPTIAKLCRDGNLSLFTYSEIHNEEMFSSVNKYVVSTGDLRVGLDYETIPPPIERSFFQKCDFSEYASKDLKVSFFEFLRNLNVSDLKNKAPSFYSLLPEFTREGFESLDRFKELYDAIGSAHALDIFHLWTAERNRIDYFLTLDKKFVNAATNSSSVDLRVRPILPSELIGLLDLDELEAFPMIPSLIYTIQGTFTETELGERLVTK